MPPVLDGLSPFVPGPAPAPGPGRVEGPDVANDGLLVNAGCDPPVELEGTKIGYRYYMGR